MSPLDEHGVAEPRTLKADAAAHGYAGYTLHRARVRLPIACTTFATWPRRKLWHWTDVALDAEGEPS